DAAEAIADHGNVVLAGILLHPPHAIRNEIEDVILHPQPLFLRLRRGPVQHVDVVTAFEEKLDEALAGNHVEDVAAICGRHHDQDWHAVDLVGEGAVMIEIHRAANTQYVLGRGTERRSRGRDIFDPLDAALNRALDLALNPLRDRGQVEAERIEAGVGVHFCSPPSPEGGEGGRLVRGGRGAAGAFDVPACPCTCCRSVLISFSCPSIEASRSAMLTICSRLGRFRDTRYFSMRSASCFCAPAVVPPTWFMTLLNCGDAMA